MAITKDICFSNSQTEDVLNDTFVRVSRECRKVRGYWEPEWRYDSAVLLDVLKGFDRQKDDISLLLYLAYVFLNNNEKYCFHEALKTCKGYIEGGHPVTHQEKVVYRFLKKHLGGDGLMSGMLEYLKEVMGDNAGINRERFDFVYGNPAPSLRYFYKTGGVAEFVQEMERLLDNNGAAENRMYKGLVLILKGEWYLMQFRLEDVKVCVRAAEQCINRRRDDGLYAAYLFLKANVCLMESQNKLAREILSEGKRHFDETGKKYLVEALEVCDLWAQLCPTATVHPPDKDAVAYLRERCMKLNENAPLERLVTGGYMLRSGRYAEFLEHFSEQTTDLSRMDISSRVYILLFCAVAYKNINKDSQARLCLKAALQRAIPDKIVMPFVVTSEQLYSMYVNMAEDMEEYTAFLEKAMSYASGFYKNCGFTQLIRRVDTLDTLTDREKEMVSCIYQGMTNRDIAASLSISENTVKSALKNIFRKLNIHSRRELMKL